MPIPEQLKAIQNRTPLASRTAGTPVADLARAAIRAILAKKGSGISVMDMRQVSGVADYFVICTGTSDVQIRALATEIQEVIRKEYGERPWHVEGLESLRWVLIDYVDLVVHVMIADAREFYGLERLWGDAPVENVADEATEPELAVLSSRRKEVNQNPVAGTGKTG
jgi:ribosome-associated protein